MHLLKLFEETEEKTRRWDCEENFVTIEKLLFPDISKNNLDSDTNSYLLT